jgi:hypothetical protein
MRPAFGPRRVPWLVGITSALVLGYRRDLDRNRAAVQAIRQDLTVRGYRLTEVRILDLLMLPAQAVA